MDWLNILSNIKEQTISKKSILKHPEDVHCVIFNLLCLFAYVLAFWLYLHPEVAQIKGVWSRTAFIGACVIMLGWISGINVGVNFHNHAHRKIFHRKWLNDWFGRFWTFSGGWPSLFWEYSHVVIHHANLLGEEDWTVPKCKADGYFENIYLYSFFHWPWRYAVDLWRDFRGERGGKKIKKNFLKEFIIFLLLWSIPFWIDPFMALVLWVLPQYFANVVIMGPGMYVQHVGCEKPSASNSYKHSNNFLSKFFNLTMFNIGYHIEHHSFANIHWSALPKLHESLKEDLSNNDSSIFPFGCYYLASRFLGNPIKSSYEVFEDIIPFKQSVSVNDRR